jgi:hypothetical protein
MTQNQRVAAYMQEHMTDKQQLAMLNIMTRAMRGDLNFTISSDLTRHAIAICEILQRGPVYGHQSKVAA